MSTETTSLRLRPPVCFDLSAETMPRLSLNPSVWPDTEITYAGILPEAEPMPLCTKLFMYFNLNAETMPVSSQAEAMRLRTQLPITFKNVETFARARLSIIKVDPNLFAESSSKSLSSNAIPSP
ncbi:hypothetical protein R3P38DRAFT_3253930 [Favolaschia claudopus]|uniref:Uncharacterized protein n=1 Tax=Favolaschia claudopus TaxID=2862362 RepID=A0AAW0DWN2_9AGAR